MIVRSGPRCATWQRQHHSTSPSLGIVVPTNNPYQNFFSSLDLNSRHRILSRPKVAWLNIFMTWDSAMTPRKWNYNLPKRPECFLNSVCESLWLFVYFIIACVFESVFFHVCCCVCLHVWVFLYVRIFFVCKNLCMCECVYISLCMCVRAHVYVCVCVCVHVFVCLCATSYANVSERAR